MHKTKVAIIHNVVAPYRLPLFELLYQDPSLDVDVFYCSTGADLFHWDMAPRNTIIDIQYCHA